MLRRDFISLSRLNFCFFMFSSALLAGCAPPELFHWGEYEGSLYERYVESDIERTEAHLQECIYEAQKNNQRVPPGLYADYGFMLYKRGDKSGAISFFDKEKNLYPESSVLMTKLIDRVKQQNEHKAFKNSESALTGEQQ